MAKHPLSRQLNAHHFHEPGYLDPIFCWRAGRIVREAAIDVIHLHRSRDLASLSLLKRIPMVLTLQIESKFRKKDPYHRFVYSRLDRVLTITERMRGFALKALPVEADRIRTLHYGMDVHGFQQGRGDPLSFRRQLGIPEGAMVIGLVGRLEPSKGQDILIRALATLKGEFPDIHLLLPGEPPCEAKGYDRELRRLASTLGLDDEVHFIGFQANIAAVYAALDICVLASRKESFGLVLLEAMAMGVPLVATAAGGVPEIIEDGMSGLLVPPGDPEALAYAIRRLIQDPEQRQRLSRAGQNLVATKFNLDGHLDALERHFEGVIAAKGRK